MFINTHIVRESINKAAATYMVGWKEYDSKQPSALNIINVYVVSSYLIIAIYEVVTDW